jgi:hypothetical protein
VGYPRLSGVEVSGNVQNRLIFATFRVAVAEGGMCVAGGSVAERGG